MKISVRIKTNNNEAAQLGPEMAALAYLRQIVKKIEYQGKLSGPVVDGNGATIGHYKVE